MQKVRCHPLFRRLQLLVSFSFQVLFHSLSQGSFHLSLAVLVHYRSELRIQRFEDGTPMFDEWLLHLLIFGLFIHSFLRFYRTNTFFGLCFIRFQIVLVRNISLFFRFRSPLLTKSLLISFPQATKMFQFAWFFSWGFPLLDTCISPFPPYSFRFSRPFVFDLGIHEKPFHFFYIICRLSFWDIASLIPVFTVFSCIRCFIARFEKLLQSFFVAQCPINRIGLFFCYH